MQPADRRADKNKAKNEPWRDANAEGYVRIDNVTKKFGDFVAVNNVSLKIYKGEIFCLLGGSGCGKSTLLRMMAGFESPTSGSIYLDGQDMADVPPYERPVNMMFQSYALFPHMTVEKNIAFGLEQEKGLSKADIATRVTDILEIVKLTPFAVRKPHQLSGGQRQRVALARSLVKRPKLLLLDEPLGALDKKLREATQFELINIQEQLGVTFIVVTHDQEEAMTLASRIGVMNRGEIVQIGTPTEIYEFPQTKFVADFIGSVNMFQGRLVEDLPDHVRIQSDELGGTVYVDHGISSAPGATVWAAIRPEKINLLRTPPADAAENCVKGVVKEIAYMGDMSIYLVKIESGKTVRVTQPNVERLSDDERILWDETVWLSWHASSPVVVTQ
ncbi:MAG TPA: polyamine ABC transporter ATP-binding protein [Steroidobacteraceae bacterium]|jgi:putrescine transport system ATP-binding protein|nr:polyamine ABC transporter ATP-binding protein [Steroidobacteraceae bacterium]